MAALDMTTPRARARAGRLGLVRCGLTGASVLAGVFALCWAAAAANIFPASHMYISLFTTSPAASGDALANDSSEYSCSAPISSNERSCFPPPRLAAIPATCD